MPTYWFDVFTAQTWEEARAHGFAVSGFSESKYATVKRVKQGDILICYLKGAKKLVGALEVIGDPYFSHEPRIWANADFPARVPVAPMVVFAPEDSLDFLDLLKQLSVYDPSNLKSTWARFQGSPTPLQQADGALLLGALQNYRTVDPSVHLSPLPKITTKKGRTRSKLEPEVTTLPLVTPEPAIKVLADPLSALIDELTRAQRDVAHPARFELAVTNAFAFLGLDATRHGQPNQTDVLVNSQLGHERFRAIIDAKASSSGKVPEGQINWTAVASHRQQASADYAAIVGEKFAGGNLQRFAADSGISLIETEQLAEVLRLHAKAPFPAADLRPLFAAAGPVSSVIADLRQKAQATEQHWQLVAEIIRLVAILSRYNPPLMTTTANLHAVLVSRVLTGNGENFRPPAEQDVRDAVAFLASRSVGILRVVDAETSSYRLATSEQTALRRLQAIDATIHSLLKENTASSEQSHGRKTNL